MSDMVEFLLRCHGVAEHNIATYSGPGLEIPRAHQNQTEGMFSGFGIKQYQTHEATIFLMTLEQPTRC